MGLYVGILNLPCKKNNARQASCISELGLSKIIMTRKSLKDEKEVKKNKQSETEHFIDKDNSKIIVSLFQKLREAFIDILKPLLSGKTITSADKDIRTYL